MDYNYGTAMNKLIDYYNEMLGLIIQARLASDRIDEWKEILNLVTNPDQANIMITRKPDFYRDYL